MKSYPIISETVVPKLETF